jgi:diguanylate cyclase (GGDEF)-like protein/PAS domain S-box-containing protein
VIGWLNVYMIITVVAGGISVVIAVLAWRRRHVPGAAFLAVMMASAAVWCGAVIGEFASGTLSGKVFWARLGYLGVVSIPWSWLLFCLAYTGRTSRHPRRVALALAIVPALTLAFVFLSPRVPLVWSSVSFGGSGHVHPLVVEHGRWFWANTAYGYACLLGGAAFLLHAVFSQVRRLTAQGVTIVLAIALPWVANLATISGLIKLDGLDLTPPAIVASGVLISVGLRRLQALDVFPGILPVARDAVFEGMQDGVLVVDSHGCVLIANRAAGRLLANDGVALVGRPLVDILAGVDSADTCFSGSEPSHEEGNFCARVPDGSGCHRFLEVVTSSLRNGSHSSGSILVMRDITERRDLEEQIRHKALHDELTGLPNRTLLGEHLAELLGAGQRKSDGVALLLIDLDRFKEINDTFGHEAGDRLLCVVAGRIRETIREGDLVARLGGDEFGVVLPACGNEDAMRLAAALREALIAPLDFLNQQVCVTASIGVAASPLHGRDAGTLFRHADVALYLAKESAQGTRLYQASLDPNSPERIGLVNDLRTAIAGGKLDLYYQPEIDIASGELARLEALARWPRDDGRMVSPVEFIPLAQQNGLLPGITAWALRTALQQRSAWSEAGLEVDVAVNLSALDLRDPGLTQHVTDALRDAGVEAGHLWLEITETSAMSDPERARRTLAELREIGVKVAIDDFGTGQSSLAYLQTLPACDVKIDRSFVSNVATKPRDGAIVRAAVALAHDLGLTVTAEGVETAGGLQRLRELGCDNAQGYLIARPMPADEVARWLRESRPARRATEAPPAASRAPQRRTAPRPMATRARTA